MKDRENHELVKDKLTEGQELHLFNIEEEEAGKDPINESVEIKKKEKEQKPKPKRKRHTASSRFKDQNLTKISEEPSIFDKFSVDPKEEAFRQWQEVWGDCDFSCLTFLPKVKSIN